MNLKKVKLVVSDMDGTLLNDKGEVSPLFYELFHQLKKQNIHFCAASGRQYDSIINKLSSIKNDIFVIADNGAIAKRNENTLIVNTLSFDKTIKIIPILRNIKEINIVLCTGDTAFIEKKDKKFISILQEYYTSFHIVEDLIEIAKTRDVLKIAAYHFESTEKHVYPAIKHLEKDVLIKISGQHWLDISDEKANKGNALREVQKIIGATKEETMVFGDYHNDKEMLQEADFSFAMKNAHKDILEIANFSTESNNNFGVEKVLKQLIESKK